MKAMPWKYKFVLFFSTQKLNVKLLDKWASVCACTHARTHAQQEETVNSGYEAQHQGLRLRQATHGVHRDPVPRRYLGVLYFKMSYGFILQM